MSEGFGASPTFTAPDVRLAIFVGSEVRIWWDPKPSGRTPHPAGTVAPRLEHAVTAREPTRR